MASYQARGRDPLFDSRTQALLERRGKELIGIAILALCAAVVILLASYSPDDPSWMVATDEPVRNALGRPGAAIAKTLFVILGHASWALPVLLGTWGLRFVLHWGEERAFPRVVFAPIAMAILAIYASSHAPVSPEVQTYGGIFGDTVLAALVQILPFGAGFSLKALALVFFAASIASLLFALGATFFELRWFGRFLLVGLVTIYAVLLKLLGKSAKGSVKFGAHLHARAAERRETRAQQRAEADARAAEEAAAAQAHAHWQAQAAAQPHAQPPAPAPRVLRADTGADVTHMAAPAPEADYAPMVQDDEPRGLLARMPSLLKRTLEPELVEHAPVAHMDGYEEASGDRVSSRIADAIKARSVTQAPSAHRDEPPLTAALRKHRKGPDPMILPKAPAPDAALFAQPEDDVLIEDEAQTLHYAPEPATPAAPVAPAVPAPMPAPMPEAKRVVQHPVRKPQHPSSQAKAEAQPKLKFEDSAAEYETPPLSLLSNPMNIERHHLSDEALEENARMLESVLDDYGVKGEIVSVRPGPVVTMYELEPAPGLKASRVIGLADDIARSMSALSARVSTVPGRSVIGIELPNANREKVVLREILAARDFGDSNMRLPLALGKDIGGDPIVANLAKMPHLLIAGTTGSGKSVAINTMILSLLYKLTPEECRLIMIDPKMLELSVYDGIPHLLSPVVTDPKKAVVALKWVVGEMEERYRRMSKMGVRNIEGFNGRVRDALAKGELFSRTVQTGFDEDTGEPIFETEEFQPEALPYIVVIVDEMADLMMVAGKEIEACIQRLAQMARASGIHLIMATQRPSVDVITGTIKANFPTRISFQVTSKVDSRTILGEQGAEQLLGMGDMLYMAGGAKITRVHGPFVSDEEVEEIVTYLKSYGPPDYIGGVVDGPDEDKESDIDLVLGLGGNTDAEDALYDTAVAIVVKDRKCSTSYIQRKLAIGYNKAARLVEQMEEQGVVSAANHVGKREILVPEQ